MTDEELAAIEERAKACLSGALHLDDDGWLVDSNGEYSAPDSTWLADTPVLVSDLLAALRASEARVRIEVAEAANTALTLAQPRPDAGRV